MILGIPSLIIKEKLKQTKVSMSQYLIRTWNPEKQPDWSHPTEENSVGKVVKCSYKLGRFRIYEYVKRPILGDCLRCFSITYGGYADLPVSECRLVKRPKKKKRKKIICQEMLGLQKLGIPTLALIL